MPDLDQIKSIALGAIGVSVVFFIFLLMFVRFVLNPTFPDEGYQG